MNKSLASQLYSVFCVLLSINQSNYLFILFYFFGLKYSEKAKLLFLLVKLKTNINA